MHCVGVYSLKAGEVVAEKFTDPWGDVVFLIAQVAGAFLAAQRDQGHACEQEDGRYSRKKTSAGGLSDVLTDALFDESGALHHKARERSNTAKRDVTGLVITRTPRK